MKALKKHKNKEFTSALIDVLRFVPKADGEIMYNIVKTETNEYKYTVRISPSCFMANFAARNPELKIEKREFWDANCQEYIVSLEVNSLLNVWTILNRTLPRDAHYLDLRR